MIVDPTAATFSSMMRRNFEGADPSFFDIAQCSQCLEHKGLDPALRKRVTARLDALERLSARTHHIQIINGLRVEFLREGSGELIAGYVARFNPEGWAIVQCDNNRLVAVGLKNLSVEGTRSMRAKRPAASSTVNSSMAKAQQSLALEATA